VSINYAAFIDPDLRWDIHAGDAVECLALLADESADLCVTSPPYWWQRDYGIEGQYGLEPTPSEYVKQLVEVFDQVRRVLVDRGSLWLNIGDSFNNRTVARPSSHQGGLGHSNGSITTSWAEHMRSGRARMSVKEGGLKEKDLVGIPWAVATALRESGWWLRSEVIWAKPYGQPESVKDRPCRAHETIFLLTKQWRDYTYNLVADSRRSVWIIPPSSADDDHSAAYPIELVKRCIAISSLPGDTVLDPFAGSCTTGIAAHGLGRGFVGIDLDPETASKGAKRMARA
jgi:site-specific DNA-methyltransferase (cytosine-N4-specific)